MMRICSDVLFSLRDQWMLERLSQAICMALVCNIFLQNSWYSISKQFVIIYKALKSFDSQIESASHASEWPGSIYSQREQFAATAAGCVGYSQLGNILYCCLRVRHVKAVSVCRSAAPRAWQLIVQSKPSISFWKSLRKWWPEPPDDRQGLKLGFKLEFCCLTIKVLSPLKIRLKSQGLSPVKVLSPLKSQNILRA